MNKEKVKEELQIWGLWITFVLIYFYYKGYITL
jgi:hypothetical protein